MTTPPPRARARLARRPRARARARVSVSAAPGEKREKREKTDNPDNRAYHARRRRRGGRGATLVPTTQFGVTQNKAEDARVDSSEAETQTEGPKEREEKNDRSEHLDPTRTPFVRDARRVETKPFVSRDEPDDFDRPTVPPVAAREAPPRAGATRVQVRERRDSAASRRTPVPRAGHAAPFGSATSQIPIGAHPRARRWTAASR